MATPEHEDPIEALGSRCPHKAFRDRVRPRRADGGLDDLGAFRLEDVVETGRELRVPVADKELHWTTCLGQVADQVPGDLGDKAVVWVFGDPEEVSPSGSVLDGEQDIEPLENHRVNGEEVCRQDPFRLGTGNANRHLTFCVALEVDPRNPVIRSSPSPKARPGAPTRWGRCQRLNAVVSLKVCRR